jgi:nicotinamide-nucleotide amidase
MHGEIIATGTELLTGRVADLNARYAARRLHESCLNLERITFLKDAAPQLAETLLQSLGRSQFVIVTGGLGPTDDDITVAAASQAFQLRLVHDEHLLARIRRCLAERQIPWEDRYARLALVPEGAVILDPGAAACGFSLKQGQTWFFFLPGVPLEMQPLFDALVLPALLELSGCRECVEQCTLRLFGITESRLQEIIHQLAEFDQRVAVGYYPNFPETHLSLTVRGPDRQALQGLIAELVEAVRAKVGDMLLEPEAESLEELVGLKLRRHGASLAVAESCSGGLICHRLTNIPGSSDYFLGGVVTYSNHAKMDLLQVPPETIGRTGAVSADTARAMALGVQQRFHSTYGLAVTGIAGPGGGTPEKPVGTVHLALAGPCGVEARQHFFHGNREMIKILTAQTALDWLRRELQDGASLSGH